MREESMRDSKAVQLHALRVRRDQGGDAATLAGLFADISDVVPEEGARVVEFVAPLVAPLIQVLHADARLLASVKPSMDSNGNSNNSFLCEDSFTSSPVEVAELLQVVGYRHPRREAHEVLHLISEALPLLRQMPDTGVHGVQVEAPRVDDTVANAAETWPQASPFSSFLAGQGLVEGHAVASLSLLPIQDVEGATDEVSRNLSRPAAAKPVP
mmetsp:Transcript_149323/g.479519  ORF Transcript_149323/g.479519 Transcript_149323/m.479519 type:complete len:213 (-) Transcript_149323:150-788(-)